MYKNIFCLHKIIDLVLYQVEIFFFINQIEYQKQKKETIDNYRGYQTMDSKDHPVVQQGIKAAEVTSNVS